MSAFFALIKFLWNNSSQVLTLLEVLPDALQAAGSAMEIAGDSATSAGTFIRGNGTQGVNVRQAVGRSADAVELAHTNLTFVKDNIKSMAAPLTAVAPVGGFMATIDTQLITMLSQIENVAIELNNISSAFNNMGNDLKDVGEQLTNVGNELQQIN